MKKKRVGGQGGIGKIRGNMTPPPSANLIPEYAPAEKG